MMRWFFYFALAFTVGLGLANEGLAFGTGNANASGSASWCYNLVNGSGGSGWASGGGSGGWPIISPLVECFTDSNLGIIPTVTVAFLNSAQATYVPLVGIMCLLAIAYYGARIFIGDVQRLKASTFILGLKMGGIYIFLNNAAAIYEDMVNVMQQFSYLISNAATTAHSTGFCVGAGASGSSASDTSQWQQGLWGRWDCIFQYVLGLSKAGFAVTSMASFLFLMLFSASAGIIIFFLGLYLILSLVTAAFRFVHVYLVCFLSLSFMFCIGYLFVPLLLFRNTIDYFKKWLILVFGFILTPVMMFGFMGMMLVALDIALFSGQYSVFCKIGGTSYCSNATSGAAMFQNFTSRTEASGYTANANPYLLDSFKPMAFLALENPISETAGGSGGFGSDLASGFESPAPCKRQYGGWMGFNLCNLQTSGGSSIPGSQYVASGHYGEQKMGFDNTALNLSALASGAGTTCNLTNMVNSGGSGYVPVRYYSSCPYLQSVLVSVAVAALLVYIMMALLTYIPTLASNLTQDLISQDFVSGIKNPVMSKVFGQGTMQNVLGLGKETALGAAKGFSKGGGIEGAAKGGSSSAWRMIDSLLLGER